MVCGCSTRYAHRRSSGNATTWSRLCAGRDMGALFRLLRQHAGASQMRIAITIGVTTNRVSLTMNGRSAVTALATFERIATGLDMPDDARLTLGIAPHREDR